jgi:hypothetical protein
MTFDALVETVLALLVDRDRQATDDDDFGVRRRCLDIFASGLAQCRVVAGDVEVANRVVVDARGAIDKRDERALALDFLDGVDQRIRVGRQDDERVDALGLEVLHGIRLACRIRRGLDDDVEARMLLHQQLGDTLGVKHHACRPAVVGGRDRNADRDLLLLLRVGHAGQRHHGDGCNAH